MTLGARLMAFFPLLHVLFILFTLKQVICHQTVWDLAFLLFAIYLWPVILFRGHAYFFPLQEKKSAIDQPVYSPWWTSHQLQLLFIALPWLEALLRIVPGVYSAWLRLWGSRVGSNVHWTPLVEMMFFWHCGL